MTFSLVLSLLVLSAFLGCQNPANSDEPAAPSADAPEIFTIISPLGYPLPDGGDFRWVRDYSGATGDELRTFIIYNGSDSTVSFGTPAFTKTDDFSDSFDNIRFNFIDLADGDAIKPQETREIFMSMNYYTSPGTLHIGGQASLVLHTSDPAIGDYSITVTGVLASI